MKSRRFEEKQNRNVWPLPFELIFFFVSHHSAALFRSVSLDENETQPLGVHFPPLGSGEVKRQ